MHLAPLIRDLAIILSTAALMSLIFQRLRQPVVLGYIIAGIIVGPHTPPFQMVTDIPNIQTWAECGVIFLMFSLGLEFSFRKLARVGGSAIITAGMEVAFFLPVGFGVGRVFGWSFMDSLFLGAMLAISSTTIIIKALDELKLKTHRFAELIFAVLIVEDLLAILLLVALSTVATSDTISAYSLFTASIKLVIVVGSWFIAGYFLLPRLMRYVGRVGNNEMITLVSIGLCLAMVVIANYFHYSTALGAFIMGSILAETPILHKIEDRVESLRDLFGAIFFVSIGMLIDPKILLVHWDKIAILCAVTIIGKILSTSFGALVSGQTFRNSVRVGFGLAQIGEFSFIIASLGVSLNVTSDFLYPIAVAVSLVTTFTTPYLIRASDRISDLGERFLPQRTRQILNRYAVWAEQRKTGVDRSKGTLGIAFRWLINSITVTAVFVASASLLLPRIEAMGGLMLTWSHLIGWLIAAAVSSPFIWAMLTVFQRHRGNGNSDKTPARAASILLSRILTVVWVAVLSIKFYPGRYVAVATVLFLGVVIVMFYKRLEKYYGWYESRFLSTFEESDAAKTKHQTLRHLAPWDAHFVKLEVHPNAALVKKRLIDAELRTKRGVNVVAIQRGLKTIIAPKPDEVILPNDELVVLGTDEQVDAVRADLDKPPGLDESQIHTSSYQLIHAQLSKNSPFAGLTIRQSGIRENYNGMVVGLERDGRKNITPESDLLLQAGDVVWLVTEKENIDRILPLLNP